MQISSMKIWSFMMVKSHGVISTRMDNIRLTDRSRNSQPNSSDHHEFGTKMYIVFVFTFGSLFVTDTSLQCV